MFAYIFICFTVTDIHHNSCILSFNLIIIICKRCAEVVEKECQSLYENRIDEKAEEFLEVRHMSSCNMPMCAVRVCVRWSLIISCACVRVVVINHIVCMCPCGVFLCVVYVWWDCAF